MSNGWNIIRSTADYPDTAGYEVLVTIESITTGQLAVTFAFIGYGDNIWYTCDNHYMQDPKGKDNRFHKTYRVIAWKEKPEPYNPYLIDGRKLVNKVSERIKTDRSTMEIKKDIIPMIEKEMKS